MATKEIRVGSVGPFLYDDADFCGVETDGVLRASGTPTDPNDLVRLTDISSLAAGITVIFTVVSNMRLNVGVVEMKTKSLTFTNGVLTAAGAESAWTPI